MNEEMINLQHKIVEIISKADIFHDLFYETMTFSGPSLYFHCKVIQQTQNGEFYQGLEYIYATLASWGMHRMGRGGAKMRSFDDFVKSIEPLKEKIITLSKIDFKEITTENWKTIECLFKSISVMETRTQLIGNAKVLAHLLPNLVPPIDREYTLKYVNGNKNIKKGIEQEWILFRYLLEIFFFPIATAKGFETKAKNWIDSQKYNWDTSIFKVIDNLVIGAIISKRKQKN